MWWLILGAALAAPVDPGAVVAAALEHAPTVVAAEARVESATGRRSQSGGLRYNPELELGVGVDGSRLQGQLVQPLSLTGEGMQDRRMASAELDAAEAAFSRARLETAATARRAYGRLSLAEASSEVAERHLQGATRLRAVAEARLQAGDAPELDAQLARLEEARAVATWLEAGRLRTALRADLVALTGLPVDVELEVDPMAAAEGLTGSASAGSRSDVASAAAGVDAAEALLARERAATLPPVALGAFYELDDGRTVVGPTLSIQLPLWKQNQGGRAEARGKLMTAQAELSAAEGRAQVQSSDRAGRQQDAVRAAAILDGDPVADATRSLAALQDAYALGELDLTSALLLQARVIEGERGWYAARAAMADTWIELALADEDPSLAGPR